MVWKLKTWVKVLIWLVIAAVVGLIVWQGKGVYEKAMYPKKYSELVEKYAEQYGVDENFVYAVIKTESGFEPNARSENDAKGLMQITEDTFHWIGTKLDSEISSQYTHDDMFQPEVNIMYGTFLLSYLEQEFGDDRVVLSAYHAGRGAANQWLADENYSSDGKTLDEIPYSDTNHYVNKVMKNYERYNRIYGATSK
ncbi:MAG: lytic transglycosylase domain-containing protein [Massiliimalia sp.]|jgi:soluble lytic murein transglycosylase